MNVYIDLVNKGILQEQTDWSGYQGSINNGTVVGTINGSWICSTIMSTDQEEQKGNWAVTNMPKLNDYQAQQTTAHRVVLHGLFLLPARTMIWPLISLSQPGMEAQNSMIRFLTDLGAIAT